MFSISCPSGSVVFNAMLWGNPNPITSGAFKFDEAAPSVCGSIRIVVEGKLDSGTDGSGSRTILPPKSADDPAERKQTWKATKQGTGK